MKKTLVALAVSGLAASAFAAPQANTFYVGAKAGWGSFHDGLKQLDSKYNGTDTYGINKNTVTYGAFVGYQILNTQHFGLATEVGYDFFGRVRGHQPASVKEKQTFAHRAHGAHVSLKASYPVLADLDVFARAGVALVNNKYKTVDIDTYEKSYTKRFQTSALFGAGVEYAITPALAAHVEWQWLNNVGKAGEPTLSKIGATDYRPDLQSVQAGITYRFGQGAAPVAAPEVVTKNFAFSSDVLFAFGKSNLRPEAANALDGAYNEIQGLGLADPAVQVNGYTDRIGKDAPNLALSQRRAETVANYLVSKGVNPANLTAVGYGKANPVTGNTCDAVKGRKALIACLAPDRRVEVQVQGSKQVTM
ncbi:hypothetical protein A4G20_00670 [Pasteurellaceae bacterium RH1A]|nr:hypothetical protein A4G20_00670 [Pasteurellaceae bacterium RH1A]